MNMFFMICRSTWSVTTGRSTVAHDEMTKKKQRNEDSPTNTTIDNSPPVCNVSEGKNSSEEGL